MKTEEKFAVISGGLLEPNELVQLGLQRFPLNVWEKILKNSCSYSDIYNVVTAAKLPPNVLSRFCWARLQFPEVFPILASSLHYLSFQEFGICRLVCRSWNESIRRMVHIHSPLSLSTVGSDELWGDNFLEMNSQRDPNSVRRNYYADLCQASYLFWNYSKFTNFLHHFQTTHPPRIKEGTPSPFHCRNICIPSFRVMEGDDGLRLPTPLTPLVHFYGHHLRVLDLSLNSLGWVEATLFYLEFHEWVECIPNVEVMRLTWYISTSIDDDELPQHFDIPNGLQRQIRRFPLPPLNKLTFLEAIGVPYPILSDILRSSGRHLEKMEINDSYSQNTGNFSASRLRKCRLENLKEFKLKLSTPLSKIFSKIPSNFPWKSVEKFHLDLFSVEENVHHERISFQWDFVFPFLNRLPFADNLTHLRLELPQLEVATSFMGHYLASRTRRLILPNVSHFALAIPPESVCSIDFILHLKKLQILSVHQPWRSLPKEDECDELTGTVNWFNRKSKSASSACNKRKTEIIQFNGFFDRMYSSNIWKLFPELVIVNLEFKDVTEEWRKNYRNGLESFRRKSTLHDYH